MEWLTWVTVLQCHCSVVSTTKANVRQTTIVASLSVFDQMNRLHMTKLLQTHTINSTIISVYWT